MRLVTVLPSFMMAEKGIVGQSEEGIDTQIAATSRLFCSTVSWSRYPYTGWQCTRKTRTRTDKLGARDSATTLFVAVILHTLNPTNSDRLWERDFVGIPVGGKIRISVASQIPLFFNSCYGDMNDLSNV